MISIPDKCVVDTNVATTANRMNDGASERCVTASAKALDHVMRCGHVYLDDKRRILREYQKNLLGKKNSQPGPGTVFLKWILTNEWNSKRITRVPISEKREDPEDFHELAVPVSVQYDRSDKKFLAVAAAHPEHPVILQSFDSKWWGWQKELEKIGVSILFLCPEEISKKHSKKMGNA